MKKSNSTSSGKKNKLARQAASGVKRNALQPSIVRTPGSLLPAKLHVTFRYQHNGAYSTSAAGYAVNEFSMNSPYDPLYTVGGGICTGFTTLMNLYSRFFVRRAKISVQPCAASNTGDYIFILPVRSDEAGAGVVPTVDMITEGQESVFNCTSNGMYTYLVLTSIKSPQEFQGLGITAKDELSGAITTDPVIQPAWYVGLFSNAGAGHTATLVTFIEYETELYRPNTLSDA